MHTYYNWVPVGAQNIGALGSRWRGVAKGIWVGLLSKWWGTHGAVHWWKVCSLLFQQYSKEGSVEAREALVSCYHSSASIMGAHRALCEKRLFLTRFLRWSR